MWQVDKEAIWLVNSPTYLPIYIVVLEILNNSKKYVVDNSQRRNCCYESEKTRADLTVGISKVYDVKTMTRLPRLAPSH